MERTSSAVVRRHMSARLFSAVIAVVACCLAMPARAQSIPPPATYTAVDENGVNIATGELFTAAPSISIGQPGSGGLIYQRTYSSDAQGWRDNVTGTID